MKYVHRVSKFGYIH